MFCNKLERIPCEDCSFSTQYRNWPSNSLDFPHAMLHCCSHWHNDIRSMHFPDKCARRCGTFFRRLHMFSMIVPFFRLLFWTRIKMNKMLERNELNLKVTANFRWTTAVLHVLIYRYAFWIVPIEYFGAFNVGAIDFSSCFKFSAFTGCATFGDEIPFNCIVYIEHFTTQVTFVGVIGWKVRTFETAK